MRQRVCSRTFLPMVVVPWLPLVSFLVVNCISLKESCDFHPEPHCFQNLTSAWLYKPQTAAVDSAHCLQTLPTLKKALTKVRYIKLWDFCTGWSWLGFLYTPLPLRSMLSTLESTFMSPSLGILPGHFSWSSFYMSPFSWVLQLSGLSKALFFWIDTLLRRIVFINKATILAWHQ